MDGLTALRLCGTNQHLQNCLSKLSSGGFPKTTSPFLGVPMMKSVVVWSYDEAPLSRETYPTL